MALIFDLKSCLDAGLWETTLLAFEAEPGRRTAVASFRDATPAGTTFLELRPIGRIAASLRKQADLSKFSRLERLQYIGVVPPEEIIPFEIDALKEIVQSIEHRACYTSEVIDIHEKPLAFKSWPRPLSLDWRSGEDGRAHSITLSFGSARWGLDLCVWFDDLIIRDSQLHEISLETFAINVLGNWCMDYTSIPPWNLTQLPFIIEDERRRIEIGDGLVRFSRNGLLRQTNWEEPLSAYGAVGWRCLEGNQYSEFDAPPYCELEELWPSGEDMPSTGGKPDRYEIMLWHPTYKKSLELCYFEHPLVEVDAFARDIASVLGLPFSDRVHPRLWFGPEHGPWP